jgi:Periplasmic protease
MTAARFALPFLLTAALAALAAPAAFAADEEAAFDPERLAPWAQIESLAWPLEVAAAPKCASPSWRIGAELLASPAQGLFVRSVADGSPAAGKLQQFDQVVAFNGKRLSGIDGYEDWVSELRAEAAESNKAQRWTIVRDGAEQTVEVQPQQVCHIDIMYASGTTAAWLRREEVVVFTPALFDIAPEPWMIQAQIAHDLGHRLAQHQKTESRRIRFLGAAGNVVSALGGPGFAGGGDVLNIARRPEAEVEADRNGIDLATAIGLPEADLIQYWVTVIEKQAATGAASKWLTGHPAHPSRIEALQNRWDALHGDPAAQ